MPCTLAQLWHKVTRRAFWPVFVALAGAASVAVAGVALLAIGKGAAQTVGGPMLVVGILVHQLIGYLVAVRVRRRLRARYAIGALKEQSEVTLPECVEDDVVSCMCLPCSVHQCMHYLNVTPPRYKLLSRTGAGERLAEPV